MVSLKGDIWVPYVPRMIFIEKYTDIRIYGYTDIRLYGYTDIRKYTDFDVASLKGDRWVPYVPQMIFIRKLSVPIEDTFNATTAESSN